MSYINTYGGGSDPNLSSDFLNANLNEGVALVTGTFTTFTINSGAWLGGGGMGATTYYTAASPGANALTISSTGNISVLTNNGYLVGGGGGGGKAGGNGGRGGGGGSGGNADNSTTYNLPGVNGGDNSTTNSSGASSTEAAGGGGGFNGSGGGGGGYYSNRRISTGGSTYSSGLICFGGGGGGYDNNAGQTNGIDGYGYAGGGGGGGGYAYACGGGGGAGGGSGGTGKNGYGAQGGGGQYFYSDNGSGGGGSGGGKGGSVIYTGYEDQYAGLQGGDGGYSIVNEGIIGTLNNSQCLTNIYYGPLFYSGNIFSNYNIIINSDTDYGQIYFPPPPNTTTSANFVFSLLETDYLTTLSTTENLYLTGVLVNLGFSGTIRNTVTLSSGKKLFWKLLQNTYVNPASSNSNSTPPYMASLTGYDLAIYNVTGYSFLYNGVMVDLIEIFTLSTGSSSITTNYLSDNYSGKDLGAIFAYTVPTGGSSYITTGFSVSSITINGIPYGSLDLGQFLVPY